MSVCVMYDWKLSVTPVVRLERPNKTFVLTFRTHLARPKFNGRKCIINY